MKKILVFAIFPAPYRTAIFDKLAEEYDVHVIFARNNDANRDPSWFSQNFNYKCTILSPETKKQVFVETKKSIREYDLVLFYDFASNFAIKLKLLCQAKKIPFVLNCDGSFDNKGFVKNIVKDFIVSGAKMYFASGEYAKRYFLNHGANEKDVIIHNFTSIFESDVLAQPLNIQEKNAIKQELGLSIDRKTVLSVGQFTYRKGYDFMLSGWKEMDAEYDLVIIGGGEDENLYKSITQEKGLKNVKLEGFKPKDVITRYMQACDVFVLPTREDIWGLVINEALACGVPVITTNRCIAGLEMIRQGENGFTVDIEDSAQLNARIKDTLSCEESEYNAMCHKALDSVRDFTIEYMCDKQISGIHKILK